MISFGITTDIHHGSHTDRWFKYRLSGPRFYSEALGDLDTFATAMEADTDVEAIISMGDTIEDDGTNSEAEMRTLLSAVETKLSIFSGAHYYLLGNWDMHREPFYNAGVGDPQEWFSLIVNGTRSPETIDEIGGVTYNDANVDAKAGMYYAFKFSDGTIGIVLDTHWLVAGDTRHYTNAATTGQGLASAQRTWLTNYLAAHTTENIIVFIHRWLWPDMTSLGNYFNAGDAAAVITILEAAPGSNVAVVFQGHHHPGSDGWWNDAEDPEEYNSGVCDFCTIKNGIKYFALRCPIVGWGSSSGASTNNGSGGEATPASVYYKVTAGEFVKDKFDVKVTGYGVNPAGQSQSQTAHAIIGS